MMQEVRLIDANALEPFYESGTDPLDTYADMTYIRAEHIETAPTIDPEVRHGRWQEIGGYEPENQGFACSVCDFATTDKSRFCPNCGARMDGGAENGSD